HANQAPRSLFSGVLRCAQCETTVSRVSKGEYVYLVCARVNTLGRGAAGHPYQPVRYERIEKLFQQRAAGIIKDAPRTSDEDLEEQIRRRGVTIDALTVMIDELIEELITNKSATVRREG